MKYLKKHAFFLIFSFFLSLMSSGFINFEINAFLRWSLAIFLSLNFMLVLIPQTWFWTERRFEHKSYRSIKFTDVLRAHPVRLLLQYAAIIIYTNIFSYSNNILESSNPFTLFGILASIAWIVILTPVYLDYFTNSNLFPNN